MFCPLTVFQLGEKNKESQQSFRSVESIMTGDHAAIKLHKQRDKLRAHFVCFMCIGKIKGLRAEQILETGSKVLENNDSLCDVLPLQACHLLTAAWHYITVHLGLGQKLRW